MQSIRTPLLLLREWNGLLQEKDCRYKYTQIKTRPLVFYSLLGLGAAVRKLSEIDFHWNSIFFSFFLSLSGHTFVPEVMIWGEWGVEILYVWVCRDGLWEKQAGVQMGRGLMGDFSLVLPVSKLTEARLAVLSWCKSENYVWCPKKTWKRSRLDVYLMSVTHSMKYWMWVWHPICTVRFASLS